MNQNRRGSPDWRTGIALLIAGLPIGGCSPASNPADRNQEVVPVDTVVAAGGTRSIQFLCDGGPAIRVRFLGPETVELATADDVLTLQRERSASGARYSGDDALFWNKGDEATVRLGSNQYRCLLLQGVP